MAQAPRDTNRVPTLLGVSNADGETPIVIWANPVTHALFVENAGGSGTVTSVSVVNANGFNGTVANATTTPAITLTTTVTGILKGNGTAISAATADVDYLTPTTASSTYLTQANAASTYLTITNAGTTYVPYTGATGDVTLGTHKLTAQNMAVTQYEDFTGITTPATPSAGFSRLYSQLGVDGIARMSVKSPAGFDLTIFRDSVQRVFNNTVSTITKGSAVYITGQNSSVPSIAPARADSTSTFDVFGILIADALAGGFSTIQFAGQAKNIDTSAFNAGDKLYLSDSVAGALTSTAPSDPSFVVPIGVVLVKDASVGEIFMETDHPMSLSLNNLSDVIISSPTVDQILRYNGANWVNGAGASTAAGPGVIFYNSTPVINTRSAPGGISQDGTTGNGIKVNSLSKTPVTSVTATVTISHASPAVVTWTSHGLPIDAPVVFTTNGTLPAPLVAGTTYFIISTAYGANSFEIATSVGGAAINTTTDGSGVHTGTATELTASGLAQNDTRAFAAWLYNTALGRTTIDAGVWEFDTYCGINNNTGTTTLTRGIYQVVPVSSGSVTTSGVGANTRVATITSSQFTGTYFVPSATNTVASYLQTPSGLFQITSSGTVNTANITVPTGYSNENAVTFNIWNKLLSSTTEDISFITPSYGLMSFPVTAPAFTVALTDKLGAISFVTTDQANRTLTLTFNGTTHNTRFTTPLTTLHNNLPGLQGGTSNEDYHLTAAEYTATATTGSGNFARLVSPQFTTPNIGSATGSISGNAGTATTAAALTTARLINGTSFDGSANITNNFPQGFLINGKIVPSVASNNLTVAIKGLDGNDPSATNPVYCRIGDTVRSITAALSVTKNAGTNWFNAGAAQLATQEVDYFVYLGFNATDGVVIGFSRIPYATQYADFSTTSTNEKYAGISTITNAAAADYYENIGRFGATLSAGAGYTWTVPTFTSANLIQKPIKQTRKLSFGAVTNLTIGNGTYISSYLVNDRMMYAYHNFTFGNSSSVGGAMGFFFPFSSSDREGVGVMNLLDSGVDNFQYPLDCEPTSGSVNTYVNQNAAPTFISIDATHPITWTTNDKISITMTASIA